MSLMSTTKNAALSRVLVVLVGVAHVERGGARDGQILGLRARVLAWTQRREGDLDAQRIAERVGEPVTALVRVGRVLVLLQEAVPADRGEPVFLARLHEEIDLLLRVLRVLRRRHRRAAVVRVGDRRLAETDADEPLGVLQRRRVVLVCLGPRRLADVPRQLGARLERLFRDRLVLGRTRPEGPRHLVVGVGLGRLHFGRARIHRPLREHEIVRRDRVLVLADRTILTGQRLVDLDRPRLVLGDDRWILHAGDADLELLLGDVGAWLAVEDVGPLDEGLALGRADEVEVGQRAGDVRVRLGSEVGARVAGGFLLRVGVLEQRHECFRRCFVALLLEERPRILVECNAVDRRLLLHERVLVRARRAVVAVHAARFVADDAGGRVE